jgi:hypothetical protein
VRVRQDEEYEADDIDAERDEYEDREPEDYDEDREVDDYDDEELAEDDADEPDEERAAPPSRRPAGRRRSPVTRTGR